MRGWLRQRRFFHNGRVINGPAEGRQRLNHVGENIGSEGRQRIFPVGFAVEALAETPAVESDRNGVKSSPTWRVARSVSKVPEFPCAPGGNGGTRQTGNPSISMLLSQVMRLPRAAQVLRICQISAKPWILELPA